MATSQPLMESSSTATHAAPRAQPQRKAARTLPVPYVLPAVVTGGLLWACYHPLSWGPLAWVALVPLLCLVRSTCRPWRIYLARGSADWRSTCRCCSGWVKPI